MKTMNTLDVIKNTYKELLKIDNFTVRLQIQHVYCQLRDCIARETGQTQQETQEYYEQVAIKEKHNL